MGIALSASDNVDGPDSDGPHDDLRKAFVFDQRYAQLQVRWPEYLAGRTSHFTQDDWDLVNVELQLQAEHRSRDAHERLTRLAWNAVRTVGLLVALIVVVLWVCRASSDRASSTLCSWDSRVSSAADWAATAAGSVPTSRLAIASKSGGVLVDNDDYP